ncbi:hypothetical protein MHK_007862 [Candidatus Magnetomorum sp. HK-1]|nr:hypothetical protein MHK_007862 [Candidatus Magnetomorum sp. HK-1]
MSSYFTANAKALYQTGSLMAKINEQLAKNPNIKGDLAKNKVDEMKLSSNADAQANVIKTIDEMVGSQIDLVA